MSGDSFDTMTKDEALLWAAKQGLTLTSADYEQIAQLEQQAAQNTAAMLDTAEQSRTPSSSFVDQFNYYYPKAIKALKAAGEVLLVLTANLLIACTPIILFFILIVEVGRVMHGIQLFEVEPESAQRAAIAVVLMNLGLEVLVHYIEQKGGYKEPPKTNLSLGVLKQWWLYFRGRPTDSEVWEPREKSPAQRWKSVLWLLTRAILIIALAGSMRDVIKSTEGSWLVALQNILTNSTLYQAVQWASGLLFTLVITLGAQSLSYYVAIAAAEIVHIMQSDATNKPELILKAANLSGVQYVISKVKDFQRTQRRAMSTGADMPNLGRVGGTIPINQSDTKTEGVSDEVNGSSAGDELSGVSDAKPKSKIDTAVDMLQNDRSLRRKDTRELASLHSDISRETWRKAKKRLGIKS